MKRLFYYLAVTLVILFHAQPTYAVLRGYNISETVIMLRSELKVFAEHVTTIQNDFLSARGEYSEKMDMFNKELTSAMLSLYSQQEQYTFGTAYAAEVAQNLCDDFYRTEFPIEQWKASYDRAQERCRLLYKTLKELDSELLDDDARNGRIEGLRYLESVLVNHNKLLAEIEQDIEKYRMLVSMVETLQTEINNNYNYILHSLLLTSDQQPTHVVFSSKFVDNWQDCTNTLKGIFGDEHYYGWEFQ